MSSYFPKLGTGEIFISKSTSLRLKLNTNYVATFLNRTAHLFNYSLYNSKDNIIKHTKINW